MLDIKLMDKDNIMIVEYTKSYGRFKAPMVAIFNKKMVSESRVKELIRMDEYSDDVIHMEKKQYDRVFFGYSE